MRKKLSYRTGISAHVRLASSELGVSTSCFAISSVSEAGDEQASTQLLLLLLLLLLRTSK